MRNHRLLWDAGYYGNGYYADDPYYYDDGYYGSRRCLHLTAVGTAISITATTETAAASPTIMGSTAGFHGSRVASASPRGLSFRRRRPLTDSAASASMGGFHGGGGGFHGGGGHGGWWWAPVIEATSPWPRRDSGRTFTFSSVTRPPVIILSRTGRKESIFASLSTISDDERKVGGKIENLRGMQAAGFAETHRPAQ